MPAKSYTDLGHMIEPTEERPPYGGEIKEDRWCVTFADEWNSFQLFLCRYKKKESYTVFSVSCVMHGMENVSPKCLKEMLRLASTYVNRGKFDSENPKLVAAVRAYFAI